MVFLRDTVEETSVSEIIQVKSLPPSGQVVATVHSIVGSAITLHRLHSQLKWHPQAMFPVKEHIYQNLQQRS